MHNFESLKKILKEGGDRTNIAKRLASAIQQMGNYRWVGIYDVDEVQVSAAPGPETSHRPFRPFP